ncbi:hypothetical protein M011DRAFT_479924 [Sporormia fimetaria CBS 119925]|uniref:Uncharacterized protein n=1 Tax=Sporormia fimetaria CBS 119925 TaxID=1340428 RepID=A0A6A6V3B7_9PLEO|nr:hypothetical protein M011DRAFT_479924 [Sporormia fimetaria CBS 119925]
MPVPKIRRNSTVEEARAASGHTNYQWASFYRFTREEARRILEACPGRTWTNMPAPLRTQTFERIQVLLASEGIPGVSEDIVNWRMVIAVRDALRETASQSAPDGKENARPRPFDPVRDLDPNCEQGEPPA